MFDEDTVSVNLKLSTPLLGYPVGVVPETQPLDQLVILVLEADKDGPSISSQNKKATLVEGNPGLPTIFPVILGLPKYSPSSELSDDVANGL